MNDQTRSAGAVSRAIIEAFPMPGSLVEDAYVALDTKNANPPDVQRVDRGIRLMARPWDPASCVLPELREQVWDWLERVVIWLNREYSWDIAGVIPQCWVQHPHLVHEVAVLADVRRRAGLSLTSALLEEFHRYVLPSFTERMRTRLQSHCEDREHQPWPARGRHVRHCSEESARKRQRLYAADVGAVVDESTGETQATAQDRSFPRPYAVPDPAGPDETDTPTRWS